MGGRRWWRTWIGLCVIEKNKACSASETRSARVSKWSGRKP